MINESTVQIPSGFRGDAIQVSSPGNGIPCANPKLKPLYTQQVHGNKVVDIVTGTSIAIGVDEEGFTVPANEKVKPIGVADIPLIGTAPFFTEVKPGVYAGVGAPNKGYANYGVTLEQVTPRLYQGNALFQMGISYKKDGASKALFEIAPGDCLRAIKSTEIETAITDGTLPILFQGETVGDHTKTAGIYAGRLVKWDSASDKADEIIARAMLHRDPKAYDTYFYEGDWGFGYEVQGPGTRGQARDIFNYIGTTFDDDDYIKTILDLRVQL